MLVEFFCAGNLWTRAFAIVGAIVLAGHSVYSAMLSRRLVEWQGRFYDRIGDASMMLAAANATGGDASMVGAAIDAGASEVGELLRHFAMLVMPMALVHPVNRFIRRRYTFAWRMVLMEGGLSRPSRPSRPSAFHALSVLSTDRISARRSSQSTRGDGRRCTVYSSRELPSASRKTPTGSGTALRPAPLTCSMRCSH